MALPSSEHLQGMLAVYLAAAELTKQGFTVCVTSRNAAAADLLVTDENCRKAWSVQVKKNSGMQRYWRAGKRAKELFSGSYVYVFLLLYPDDPPDFFVVPSSVVAARVQSGGSDNAFPATDAQKYKDGWDILGTVPNDVSQFQDEQTESLTL